ncbi:hypothetical protein KI387_034582, partial [Taxus chinensis]
MPSLPALTHNQVAFNFATSLKSLQSSVPQAIDEEMLITKGFRLVRCPNNPCTGINGGRAVGGFLTPDITILQAYHYCINGVFNRDFPDNTPFKYSQQNPPLSIWESVLGTKFKVLKFNSNVQTGVINIENHPIHLHIVGQRFGNYNPQTDRANFNLNALCKPHLASPSSSNEKSYGSCKFQ